MTTALASKVPGITTDLEQAKRDIGDHGVAILSGAISPVMEMAKSVVDGGLRLSTFSANITLPGSGMMHLHADQGTDPMPWGEKPHGLNFIWCMDDFTDETGATRFVPGSHKLNRSAASMDEIMSDTVPLEAPAGSLVMMESRVWHKTGANVTNLIQYPITNYYNFSLDDVHDMLLHPSSHFGLGDGGAHCGVACDAGTPTMMLSFWARDRKRGPKIEIGRAVRMISRDTAELYGLHDRGRIAPGYRADINVIDHDRLNLLLPEIVFDLPTGARRLMQRAQGYVATFVAGERTIDHDTATGALPGALIRGPQAARILEASIDGLASGGAAYVQ